MPSFYGLGTVALFALLGYFWHSHASAGGVTRGLASGMDITESLSPAHARRRALRTRPATRVSWWTPLNHVGIELGHTLGRSRRTLAATVEDVILYIAGPRTGKSGALARHVQDAPGAALVTSTRPDLFTNSIFSRRLRPWWVFNPKAVGVIDGKGPISTLRWSPVLASCDIEHAWLIAALHVTAGATGGQKESEYWEANSTRALRLLLAAAHIGHRDMHDVYGWIGSLDDPDVIARPIAMLETDDGQATFPDWAADLRKLSNMHEKPLGSISTTLLTCVQYMADDALRHAATPGPGEHFEPAEFLAAGGTVYVIGAHEEQSPVGPLFSTFIGHLAHHARRAAARATGARLDPPLTLVLDEVTNTFRIAALPRWTGDFGGYGMPIIMAIQGRHQLVEAFGKEGAATIWQNATTKITLGGQMDPDTIRDLSMLCGLRAAEVGANAAAKRPVMEPEAIRNLPEYVALILHRNVRPVLARVQMVWERKNPPVAEPLITPEPVGSADVVHLADRPRRGV